jgi:DNA-binding NarL/FixJ family response regulator
MGHETQHVRPSTPLRPQWVEFSAPNEPALAAPDPPPVSRTRVLCVDDSPDVARMLERLLRDERDLESVGVLHSAEGIVDEVLGRRADVVVLDLTIPGCDTLAAICALAGRAPACRVIAFSGYDDPETRADVARAGGWGLVSKHGEPRDILAAIRRAGGSGPVQGT